MQRLALTLLASILVLAGCSGQRAVVVSPAPGQQAVGDAGKRASADFDAAVDRLTRAYFQQVPEAATYNGAPDALAAGADARLNDRSVAGEAARVAELEARLAELKALPVDSLSADQRRTHATLITLFDGARRGTAATVDHAALDAGGTAVAWVERDGPDDPRVRLRRASLVRPTAAAAWRIENDGASGQAHRRGIHSRRDAR